MALAPIFLAPIAAVLLSLFAQQAITFSGDKLQPKLSRSRSSPTPSASSAPPASSSSPRRRPSSPPIATALFIYLSRDLDRMIGAATAEARVLGGMMMQSLVVLLTITSRDRRRRRRDRPRLAAVRARPPAADVLPGPARGGEAVRGRPAHEGAAPQPRRGDRHQPDAARRAEGRRRDREPDPFRGRAEVVARARQRARPASPRARARWRSESARWRDRRRAGAQRPADRARAASPRSRSAARSRPSTIAPSPRRSASPTGCGAPPARGRRVTPAALRRLAGLAEARRARDLARLEGLLAEDRGSRRDRGLAATVARDLGGRAAAAGAAGLRQAWVDQRCARAPRRRGAGPAIRGAGRGGAEPRQARALEELGARRRTEPRPTPRRARGAGAGWQASMRRDRRSVAPATHIQSFLADSYAAWRRNRL